MWHIHGDEVEQPKRFEVTDTKRVVKGSVLLVALVWEESEVDLLLVKEPVRARNAIWATINAESTRGPLGPICWLPLVCVVWLEVHPSLEGSADLNLVISGNNELPCVFPVLLLGPPRLCLH